MQISDKPSLSLTEIQQWLIEYLANQLAVSPDKIDIKKPFTEYSVDSAVLIGMTGELETLLGCTLDPTLVYDYPSIDLLSEKLSARDNIDWQKNLHR